MNTVITINLNGRAYQIEEPGYRALRKYLDEAEAKLAENPDKGEIMADFEQAIAEKCDRRLGAAKNVVTTKEVEEVIAAMGPVEGAKGAGAAAASDSAEHDTTGSAAAPKRLYRIYEGSVFKGVCNGIAAYFNMDATLVRAIFILLTVLTGGGWIVAYIVLMLVMPVARTNDEIARAHGEPPFTAKDFIDRAHGEYEKYKEDPEGHKEQWKKDWREKRRAWREEWRAMRREDRDAWRTTRYHGGHRTAFGVVVSVILTVLFVVALTSLITHGVVFGHALGADHPLWVSVLFLIAVFYIISFPFRHLTHGRHCGDDDAGSGHCHRHRGSGFFVLLFLILFIWTAVTLFPPVRDAWQSLVTYLQSVRT